MHTAKAAMKDVLGLRMSASLDEIRGHGHVLPPGRYAGAEEVEDDGEPFGETMGRLAALLKAQLEESARLDRAIQENPMQLGF